MECKKCQSKWESQISFAKSLTRCPFCGASLMDTMPKWKILSGHTHYIISVDWSPDGFRIASGGLDQKVMVWDSQTGERLHVLEGHKYAISNIAWSPDGTLLASSDNDTIILWNPFNGKIHRHLRKQVEPVVPADNLLLTWSPDGKRIASGAMFKPIYIWNVDNGTSFVLTDYEGVATFMPGDIKWSPNGNLLAISDFTGTVTLWNMESGHFFDILDIVPDSLCSLSWAPDGLRLATGSEQGVIIIWDIDTANLKPIIRMQEQSDKVHLLAWSPDGSKLASVSSDRIIDLWDPYQGIRIKYVGEHQNEIFSISWSPDSKYLISAGKDTAIRLWQT